jgi:hypothetical protein
MRARGQRAVSNLRRHWTTPLAHQRLCGLDCQGVGCKEAEMPMVDIPAA